MTSRTKHNTISVAMAIAGFCFVSMIFTSVEAVKQSPPVAPAPMPKAYKPAPAPEAAKPRVERFAAPAPQIKITLPDGRVHSISPKPMPVDVQAASCRVAVSVKVRCTKAGCEFETSWGTGTLIAPGRVLTCSHLFDSGMDTLEVFFNGKPHRAKLLKRDPKPDMALIAVEGVNVQPTGYVDVFREGEPITICGYGGDGVLRTNVGRFKRWAGYVDGRQTFYMDVKNRSGDSGGGAFNSAGQLVGVQWGCPNPPDPDGVAVTSGEPMIRFLWPQD